MHLRTVLLLILTSVIGVVFTSYFVGGVLLSNVICKSNPKPGSYAVLSPFTSCVETAADEGSTEPPGSDILDDPNIVTTNNEDVKFVTANLEKGWIPWLIRQVSVLIGGLSLLVFGWAGFSLIMYGNSEEQLAKSTKMILYGVAGIVLAAFSYSLVGNVLKLFS